MNQGPAVGDQIIICPREGTVNMQSNCLGSPEQPVFNNAVELVRGQSEIVVPFPPVEWRTYLYFRTVPIQIDNGKAGITDGVKHEYTYGVARIIQNSVVWLARPAFGDLTLRGPGFTPYPSVTAPPFPWVSVNNGKINLPGDLRRKYKFPMCDDLSGYAALEENVRTEIQTILERDKNEINKYIQRICNVPAT